MILAINYANEKFRGAQKMNTKKAYQFGADRVIEYNEHSLPQDFQEKNKDILCAVRGGGYWLWKPYIILDAFEQIEEGDYLIYTDSGSAFIRPIRLLLDAMDREGTDVMCFSLTPPCLERKYSKRDALILMDCDRAEYIETPQIASGYIVVKKTERVRALLGEFLSYIQDRRIVTDDPSCLGVPEYPDFIENRHDQTIWSLLCKKYGIRPFRDPSEWGVDRSGFSDEINRRSTYPQVIWSHRNVKIHNQLTYAYYFWRLKQPRDGKGKIL